VQDPRPLTGSAQSAAHSWWEINWPSWLVDGSQVVGAVVGIVALLVAVRALSVVSRERRITHELEVLREMSSLRGSVEDLDAMVELFVRLQLLRDPRDLPLSRAAMDMGATPAAKAEYAKRYPNVPPVDGDLIDLDRFRPLREDGTFNREWKDAIARRAEPGWLERKRAAAVARLRYWRRQVR
jgi:hypothetical protein